MTDDRKLRIYIAGVHRFYEADWYNLSRRAGHVVVESPDTADVHLCMTPRHALENTPTWLRMASSDRPVIIGYANAKHTTETAIREIMKLGIRNHIIAHSSFAERVRTTARDEHIKNIVVTHIPRCYDFDADTYNKFDLTPLAEFPAENPLALTDIVTLINRYATYDPDGYEKFQQIQRSISHVKWFGRDSPDGYVNDSELLKTSRFLLHIKREGCVDNSPIRAIASGVPVLTTYASTRVTLNDEVVVNGISGLVTNNISELIENLRNMSSEDYLRLRESTWEFGAQFRHLSRDIIDRYNFMLDDALRYGTTAAESIELQLKTKEKSSQHRHNSSED